MKDKEIESLLRELDKLFEDVPPFHTAKVVLYYLAAVTHDCGVSTKELEKVSDNVATIFIEYYHSIQSSLNDAADATGGSGDMTQEDPYQAASVSDMTRLEDVPEFTEEQRARFLSYDSKRFEV